MLTSNLPESWYFSLRQNDSFRRSTIFSARDIVRVKYPCLRRLATIMVVNNDGSFSTSHLSIAVQSSASITLVLDSCSAQFQMNELREGELSARTVNNAASILLSDFYFFAVSDT